MTRKIESLKHSFSAKYNTNIDNEIVPLLNELAENRQAIEQGLGVSLEKIDRLLEKVKAQQKTFQFTGRGQAFFQGLGYSTGVIIVSLVIGFCFFIYTVNTEKYRFLEANLGLLRYKDFSRIVQLYRDEKNGVCYVKLTKMKDTKDLQLGEYAFDAKTNKFLFPSKLIKTITMENRKEYLFVLTREYPFSPPLGTYYFIITQSVSINNQHQHLTYFGKGVFFDARHKIIIPYSPPEYEVDSFGVPDDSLHLIQTFDEKLVNLNYPEYWKLSDEEIKINLVKRWIDNLRSEQFDYIRQYKTDLKILMLDE